MSHHDLTEEPLTFGESGRLMGILTLPGAPACNARGLPVFVFLNAGLLHRVGPHRLYVCLSRDLSRMGFSSLRVDLAGRGDSPQCPGLTNQQSVAADYAEIRRVLDSRLGAVPLVLAGLCSGADNAIRLALNDSRILGLVLLDPFCFPDDGFGVRAFILKYTNAARIGAWLKRRFTTRAALLQRREERVDPLTLRDLPTREQLRAAFESIRERRGRVLSVFTQYAIQYYNQTGQLGRVLGVEGYQQFSTEVFSPQAEHTYTLELHRRRLIHAIKIWAGGFIHSRIDAND